MRNSLIGASVVGLASGVSLAQPANDTCENAELIVPAAYPYLSAARSVAGANASAERGQCEVTNSTVWYRYVADATGDAVVSTCALDAPGCTLVDSVVSVYEETGGGCGTARDIGCSDDSPGCGFRAKVTASMIAGRAYLIQIGSYGSTLPASDQMMVQFRLTRPTPPPPPPPATWIEIGDAGDVPGAAQLPDGSGALTTISGVLGERDADMYLIEICDPARFSATTLGGVTFDTQLFLFDDAGFGVAMSDDVSSTVTDSTINGQFVTAAGRYHLAITEYDSDPMDSDGQALWADGPATTQRAPDGPGAQGIVGAWDGLSDVGGAYTIRLTGACFVVRQPECAACAADFDQSGGVDGQDVEAFFSDWEQGLSCADVNQDGSVEGQDVEAFYQLWEAGGC